MNIQKFYNNLEDSDVIIVHNDGNIYCHKVILKAGSSVLDTMLKNPMLEKQENAIKLLTFKTSSVVRCIKHIYQIRIDELPDNLEELEDLINLCNYLDLSLLKMQIDHKMHVALKDDQFNMLELFLMGIKYEMPNLMETTAAHIFNKGLNVSNFSLEQYKCLRNILLTLQEKYPYTYSRPSDIFGIKSCLVLKWDCEWASTNKDKNAICEFLASYSFESISEEIMTEALEYDIIKEQPFICTLLTTIINLKKKTTVRNNYY